MDALQKQVRALTEKVDALYQIIDSLSYRVSEALADKRSTPSEGGDRSAAVASLRQYTYQNHNSFERAMEHKDVLVDRNGFDSNSHPSSEKELAPEIQIKRLTAQLTAAYNRIAALEEQLLARRFH